MKEGFDGRAGLVVVPVEVAGRAGSAQLRFALDTGATSTLVRPIHLEALGYNAADALGHVQMTTGSGVESVSRLVVRSLSALGHSRGNMPVLAHNLPPSATVDGLLGLDFFRGGRLELDFRQGMVGFEP